MYSLTKKKHFIYSEDMFGPAEVKNRYLEDIRHRLLNGNASGSEVIYISALDIEKKSSSVYVIIWNGRIC